MPIRHRVNISSLRLRVDLMYNPGASIEFAPGPTGRLVDVSTDLSPDSAAITRRDTADARRAAELFLRGIIFSSDIPIEGQQSELAMLESQYPGAVKTVLATRNRVVLSVRGEHREFFEYEGRLQLKSISRRLPEALFRLAHLRATEAIAAVRKGHAEAQKSAREQQHLRQLKFPI